MVCVVSLWSCFVIVVSAKFYNLSVYNVVEHRTKSLKLCFLLQHINSLIVRYCLISVKWKSWTAIATVSIHTCLLQLRLENCKLWQRVCWHLCSAHDNMSLVLCPCFLKQWHEVPSAKIFSSPHPPPQSGWILYFKSWYKRLWVFLILHLSCYMTTIFVTMTHLNVSKLSDQYNIINAITFIYSSHTWMFQLSLGGHYLVMLQHYKWSIEEEACPFNYYKPE